MKMAKLDLSKDGISRFFLHHIEKIILALAILAMGIFFYLGMSTPAYTEKTPDQLSQLASSAGAHITKAGWDDLKEFRVSDDKAVERIDSISPVEIAKFDVGRFSGIRAKTRGRRPDPSLDLAIPTEFEIQVVQAPLIVNGTDQIGELPLATDSDDGNEGGRGGGLGAGGAGTADAPKKKRGEESVYGTVVTDVHKDLMQGFKPVSSGGGLGGGRNTASGSASAVANIVAVNAIINHKSLYDEFKKTFENTMAYTPIRDRPQYAYAQIQHKRKGKWRSIGNQVRYEFNEMFGQKKSNEVVHPFSYDEALTGPIPQIAQFDYRKIAKHSKVSERVFEDPETDDEDDEGDSGFDNFDDSDSSDERSAESDDSKMKKDKGGIRRGSDTTLYVASGERLSLIHI